MSFPLVGSALPYAKEIPKNYDVFSRAIENGGYCQHELNVVERARGRRKMWSDHTWHPKRSACEDEWKKAVIAIGKVIENDTKKTEKKKRATSLRKKLEALL